MARGEAQSAAPRLAIRCDGGPEIGAGHVARCLPVAQAFAARGWFTAFVGRYRGLARWLLEAGRERTQPPRMELPCGLDRADWSAAIVDLYGISNEEVCALASWIPMATLGEAVRCERAGILIDYHLDRRAAISGPRLLSGPAYAPLDPQLAGAGRAGKEVACVLITLGGSGGARELMEGMRERVSRSFPDAEHLVPLGGREGEHPARLADIVGRVDLAVTGAGLTAYELACAGIPQVTVGIANNQRRVIEGMRATGLGQCVDLDGGDDIELIERGLETLHEPSTRWSQSALGLSLFDGLGAQRIADGLEERWGLRRDLPRMELL